MVMALVMETNYNWHDTGNGHDNENDNENGHTNDNEQEMTMLMAVVIRIFNSNSKNFSPKNALCHRGGGQGGGVTGPSPLNLYRSRTSSKAPSEKARVAALVERRRHQHFG